MNIIIIFMNIIIIINIVIVMSTNAITDAVMF